MAYRWRLYFQSDPRSYFDKYEKRFLTVRPTDCTFVQIKVHKRSSALLELLLSALTYAACERTGQRIYVLSGLSAPVTAFQSNLCRIQSVSLLCNSRYQQDRNIMNAGYQVISSDKNTCITLKPLHIRETKYASEKCNALKGCNNIKIDQFKWESN